MDGRRRRATAQRWLRRPRRRATRARTTGRGMAPRPARARRRRERGVAFVDRDDAADAPPASSTPDTVPDAAHLAHNQRRPPPRGAVAASDRGRHRHARPRGGRESRVERRLRSACATEAPPLGAAPVTHTAEGVCAEHEEVLRVRARRRPGLHPRRTARGRRDAVAGRAAVAGRTAVAGRPSPKAPPAAASLARAARRRGAANPPRRSGRPAQRAAARRGGERRGVPTRCGVTRAAPPGEPARMATASSLGLDRRAAAPRAPSFGRAEQVQRVPCGPGCGARGRHRGRRRARRRDRRRQRHADRRAARHARGGRARRARRPAKRGRGARSRRRRRSPRRSLAAALAADDLASVRSAAALPLRRAARPGDGRARRARRAWRARQPARAARCFRRSRPAAKDAPPMRSVARSPRSRRRRGSIGSPRRSRHAAPRR